MSVTENEVNEVINAVNRLANRLDPQVYQLAMETCLTEIPDLIEHYGPRERMVRRMVRVGYELNSLLGDLDGQPSEYGTPHDGFA